MNFDTPTKIQRPRKKYTIQSSSSPKDSRRYSHPKHSKHFKKSTNPPVTTHTMKKTISVYAFREEFQDSQYKDNFTYEGLATLFDILEQYEQDTEQEQELDIVAIA
jgi:hypothetical protein